MEAAVPALTAPGRLQRVTERLGVLARRGWSSWLLLAGLTTLALVLNTWHLSQTGFGNTYYAAAARSMSESWHNFFFGSFDPGGFITVDKPPVSLWFGATASRLLGFSSWSILVPSALAGTAGVVLLWLVLRRSAGSAAATTAALVLALTPITVTVNRMNLPEPFYALALIGAAGSVLVSLESRRWLFWLVLAGVLVGIAFNTKMLAAWVPGPAFALAIVVGTRGAWWFAWREWLPRLVVLAAATFITSISWMLVVDSWPEGDRPYIGGSSDNSVSNLVIEYNGLDRVEGYEAGRVTTRGRGQTGLLRMFDAQNGGQIAWFLPFALGGGFACLWLYRADRLLRAATVLWLGWLLLFGLVFSFAEGIYHPYYTAVMAPAIAALVGISAVALVRAASRQAAWLGVAAAIVAVSLAAQFIVAGRPDGFYEPVRYTSVGVVLTGLCLLALAWRRRSFSPGGALGLCVVGLLLLPAAWSSYEMRHAASSPITPRAGPRPDEPAAAADDRLDVQRLAAWLKAHEAPEMRWVMAVTDARQAAPYIVDYGLSVAPIGGFSGRDPTVTEAEFARLLEEGALRYVMLSRPDAGTSVSSSTAAQDRSRAGTPGGFTRGSAPFAGSSQPLGAQVMFSYVQASCVPVTDPEVPVRYRSEHLDQDGDTALFDCAAP